MKKGSLLAMCFLVGTFLASFIAPGGDHIPFLGPPQSEVKVPTVSSGDELTSVAELREAAGAQSAALEGRGNQSL